MFLSETVVSTNLAQGRDPSPLKMFKTSLHTIDLCQFLNVPADWEPYYKGDLLKKILFQYLNKCECNVSLIELLLINNPFLRFAIILLFKTILLEAKLIQQF